MSSAFPMHLRLPADRPSPPMEGLPPILQTWLEAARLKNLLRQGWIRRGVPQAHTESVAEHTFGVALLALLLVEGGLTGVDPHRLLRLALVHDLGEARAGDLTPAHRVSATEKHRLEREGLARLLGEVPGKEGVLALWEEYEAQESPEACLIRELDRLEMGLQAWLYEHGEGLDLGEFFVSAAAAVRTPALAELLNALRTSRAPGVEPPEKS